MTSLEYHWFYREVVRFHVTFLWAQTEELKNAVIRSKRSSWYIMHRYSMPQHASGTVIKRGLHLWFRYACVLPQQKHKVYIEFSPWNTQTSLCIVSEYYIDWQLAVDQSTYFLSYFLCWVKKIEKSRNITKTTCFSLFILYPEFYQDTNEEYRAGTYTLRCELADAKGYYLCAEDDKVFLVVSVFVKS